MAHTSGPGLSLSPPLRPLPHPAPLRVAGARRVGAALPGCQVSVPREAAAGAGDTSMGDACVVRCAARACPAARAAAAGGGGERCGMGRLSGGPRPPRASPECPGTPHPPPHPRGPLERGMWWHAVPRAGSSRSKSIHSPAGWLAGNPRMLTEVPRVPTCPAQVVCTHCCSPARPRTLPPPQGAPEPCSLPHLVCAPGAPCPAPPCPTPSGPELCAAAAAPRQGRPAARAAGKQGSLCWGTGEEGGTGGTGAGGRVLCVCCA